MTEAPSRTNAKRAMYIGALGVVFGDIGTSPLYTVQTIFSPADPHPVAVSSDTIFGVLSMIFWSVMVIVSITYVSLVMRADNDGEGGIMALVTLIKRKTSAGNRHTRYLLGALGIFGASLFFGDSMITPAISVLSSVEGLEVAAPELDHLILPITAGVIIALFMFQRFGTGAVGRLFGPIMIVWFLTIAALGVHGIAQQPEILKALSPAFAAEFMFSHFEISFFAMAAIVLAVTGAEALYADMGHFGRRPITLAWVSLVLPACMLNYFGQGALILGDPSMATDNPFFQLGPDWAHLPMVLLATMATVIASQAVITGAFSIAHQSVQLGYLPRLRIRQTSAVSIGQIYVPWINWFLMIAVLTLIFVFKSSTALGFAYGMAVTGTITITTLLFFYYARQQWAWPLPVVIGGGVMLITYDLLFFAANLTKVFHGAWLPLLIGLLTFTVLLTWHRGRREVTEARKRYEGPLRDFVREIDEMGPALTRVKGTAVFLDRNPETTPLAMRACAERLHTLHEHVVILTIATSTVPHMTPGEGLSVEDLGFAGDGITHVTAYFGYMDEVNVPGVLRMMEERDDVACPLEVDTANYFVSEIELRRGHVTGMPRWRKALFVATSRIAADPVEYFGLPLDRTIVMGSKVEV
ncbi:MAG: KUP/HAK/KT family potassium transporter [Thermoleophilaceae bacterium]|nr:KUP/HAK/KT family potassium transporter [Thermoleophilaceae bacterium]